MTHDPKHLLRTVAGGLSLALCTPAFAQYYYEDEEWYDPSDWFDGDSYDIEEWDDYEYDAEWDEYSWYDDWEYNYDYEAYDDNVVEYSYDNEFDSWEADDSYADEYDSAYDREDEAYDPIDYVYYITYEPMDLDRNQMQSDRDRNQMQSDRNRDRSGSRDRQDQARSGGLETYNGTVEAFRHTRLRDRDGNENEYTLAKVALDNGRTVVMSLGEKSRLSQLDLQKGDEVEIRGTTGQLGNQRILIAERVRANDSSARVNGRVARISEQVHQARNDRMRQDRSPRTDRDRERQDWQQRDRERQDYAIGGQRDRQDWQERNRERQDWQQRDRERQDWQQRDRERDDYAIGGQRDRQDWQERNRRRMDPQSRETRDWQDRDREERNQMARRESDQQDRMQRRHQEMMAQRENRQQDRMSQRADDRDRGGQNSMRLKGTVAEFQSVHLDGTADAQSFVRVELESGRSATVLLGTSASVSDLDLQEGDTVMISGKKDSIDGKTVLRAERIRVEGERVQISSR